jgi:VanZ family protein
VKHVGDKWFRSGARLAFWTCAAAVLFLSLSPAPPLSISSWDKLNHVAAFMTLGLLGSICWHPRLLATGRLAAFGGFIEVLQSFTPTRQGDSLDWAADCVGLLLASLLAWAFERGYRRQKSYPHA